MDKAGFLWGFLVLDASWTWSHQPFWLSKGSMTQGVILWHQLMQCILIREIPQIHYTFVSLDHHKMRNLMTPCDKNTTRHGFSFSRSWHFPKHSAVHGLPKISPPARWNATGLCPRLWGIHGRGKKKRQRFTRPTVRRPKTCDRWWWFEANPNEILDELLI